MLPWFIDGIERMRSAPPSSMPTNNIQYASSSCSSSVNINTVMDVGTCKYTTYHRNSSPMPTTTFIASTDENNPIDKVSTQSNNSTINLRTSTSESASESTSESQPPNQPPIKASCYILTITYLQLRTNSNTLVVPQLEKAFAIIITVCEINDTTSFSASRTINNTTALNSVTTKII